MTCSNGASSSGFARPLVFPMFSTIQHRLARVINVEIDPIRVEVCRRAL